MHSLVFLLNSDQKIHSAELSKKVGVCKLTRHDSLKLAEAVLRHPICPISDFSMAA